MVEYTKIVNTKLYDCCLKTDDFYIMYDIITIAIWTVFEKILSEMFWYSGYTGDVIHVDINISEKEIDVDINMEQMFFYSNIGKYITEHKNKLTLRLINKVLRALRKIDWAKQEEMYKEWVWEEE